MCVCRIEEQLLCVGRVHETVGMRCIYLERSWLENYELLDFGLLLGKHVGV